MLRSTTRGRRHARALPGYGQPGEETQRLASHPALPAVLDAEDVLSYGTLGLIEAIERFDPSRGIKFETYAISRIRGAIIDGLRALDQIPRSTRQRAREIERALADLEAQLGRAPTDEEVA
ncbi:MAG: hypothetical protein C4345_03265, partial [Chloroflexota bacterium]